MHYISQGLQFTKSFPAGTKFSLVKISPEEGKEFCQILVSSGARRILDAGWSVSPQNFIKFERKVVSTKEFWVEVVEFFQEQFPDVEDLERALFEVSLFDAVPSVPANLLGDFTDKEVLYFENFLRTKLGRDILLPHPGDEVLVVLSPADNIFVLEVLPEDFPVDL